MPQIDDYIGSRKVAYYHGFGQNCSQEDQGKQAYHVAGDVYLPIGERQMLFVISIVRILDKEQHRGKDIGSNIANVENNVRLLRQECMGRYEKRS
jgi:hypothetical protein